MTDIPSNEIVYAVLWCTEYNKCTHYYLNEDKAMSLNTDGKKVHKVLCIKHDNKYYPLGKGICFSTYE